MSPFPCNTNRAKIGVSGLEAPYPEVLRAGEKLVVWKMLALLILSSAVVAQTKPNKPTPGQAFGAAPFGLKAGMTEDEIAKLIGRESIITFEDHVMAVMTAPRPDAEFDAYELVISPNAGLVKVMAVGTVIANKQDMTRQYLEMRKRVSRAYGPPTLSAVRNGTVGTQWRSPKPQIANILLIVNGRLSKLYLALTFEFDGFAEYEASK
jgi:hypothetical protein